MRVAGKPASSCPSQFI